MNGFHDAANSIATVVSTGVLKPTQAVAFAAFFNVVAVLSSTSAWRPRGKGIVQPGIVDTHVVFGALVGPSPGTSSPGLRHSQQLLACADRRHRGCGDAKAGSSALIASGI
jgi:PiT family inorganic phosphate transporter